LIAGGKRRDEVFPFNGPRKEFDDTKGVIRIRTSKKDRQYNGQKKRTKGQTTIYKTLHRKLKKEKHEHH
jgi:hypothetical protein